MTRSKFITTAAVVGAVGLSAGVVRAAEPTTAQPTTAELMQQVQQLQAKVQQLETKQDAIANKDVDATINQVLTDADKRSQLLQMEGFTAGWTKDKGIIIQDAAGNWVFHPNFQFQFRSTTNYRKDGKHGESDADWENGFEIRRMKFGADGNAFTPNLTYFFLWNTENSNAGGGLNLEQAWIKYFFNDDWAFRVGQFTNPVVHEQTTSSKRQLAVDRSLMNVLLTGSNEAYTQAITLIYNAKESPIYAEFGIEDGFNSANSDFRDPNEGGSTDWGALARVNWFVQGDRKEYDDFTAMNNKDDLLVIGAGGDVTQTGDSTNYIHTVDAQWENTNGLSLYAAYLGNYVNNSGAGSDDFYNWGVLVQGGYMINTDWEVFARYDYTRFDSKAVSAGESEDYCEVTLGVNWYVGGGHNAKVTVDATWLPNGSPVDETDLGILASDDHEILVRGQFQLLL